LFFSRQRGTSEFDEQHAELVPLVVEQTGVTEDVARRLLMEHNYEIVTAIMVRFVFSFFSSLFASSLVVPLMLKERI